MRDAPEYLVVVCKKVERHPSTGVTTLCDVFDVLWRSSLPADLGQFSLYVRVHRLPKRSDGKFALRGVFEGPDGRPIFDFDVTIPAKSDSGHCEAQLDSLVVEHEGLYRFVVVRDGKEVASTSFKVEIHDVSPTRVN